MFKAEKFVHERYVHATLFARNRSMRSVVLRTQILALTNGLEFQYSKVTTNCPGFCNQKFTRKTGYGAE